MLDIEAMDDIKDNKIYEVGYLLNPASPDDVVHADIATIKGCIESKQGIVIAEEPPKMQELSYTISKKIKAKRVDFDTAFFGWVKFEMNPDHIESFKKSLEAMEQMIRFLLIITVRESTLVSKKVLRADDSIPHKNKADGTFDVTLPRASLAELDKTIEALVVE